MSIDDAIDTLLQEHPGATLGETAKPGHRHYEAARGVSFKRCTCFKADWDGYTEFVGRGPEGGLHFVGFWRVVSVGMSKGMHKLHPEVPPCV